MGNVTYDFVIDTGALSAVSFEKAMFAHLTGSWCGGRYFLKYVEKLKEATRRKNKKIATWLDGYFSENIVSYGSFDRRVEIRFSTRPCDYVLHLLTRRAFEFCKKGRDNVGAEMRIPFVGCRLIKTTEVQEVETLA
jgi:hypothetical protein